MQSLFRRAAIARRCGRYADAEAAYREWIEADPADPFPKYSLGCLLLARGAFAEGWAMYEARSGVPEAKIQKPALSYPEWRGEPVKSLLLWREQGLGDQIMFASYIPELVARGISVSLLSSPSLARLFSGLGATVIPALGSVDIPKHEAWCLIGSLPHVIGTIPAGPYLGVQAASSGGVGVMWRGSAIPDPRRSIPDHLGRELLALPGARSLHPDDTGARDFQDTADIIAGLDQVVTIDTSVAHLAGAMGKPTQLLLPQDADWRWGRETERSIWYPSMRLLRQPRPGDWRSVLDVVKGRYVSS